MPSTRNIIVTGDLVIDHHIYEGERNTPTCDHKRGVRDWCEPGGATILHKTLDLVFKKAGDESWQVHLGIQPPAANENPCGHHAYAVWKPFAKTRGDEKSKVWRAQLVMGYGHAEPSAAKSHLHPVAAPTPDLPKPNILVLDDAGSAFRLLGQKNSWLLPEPGTADWILLKMSRPIAHGDLWHELIDQHSERLVCMVWADALRQECAGITQGLSWERTAEDVRDALLNNPTLAPLARCRHLIVGFSADGALWLDRSDAAHPRATLVFDASGAEGEWISRAEGDIFGYSVSMAAALTKALAQHVAAESKANHAEAPAFEAAIKGGLTALRSLLEFGHGQVGEKLPEGFPAGRVAEAIARSMDPAIVPTEEKFASAPVPWPAQDKGSWMIVEESQRPPGLKVLPPLVGIARQVVLNGKRALRDHPHACFGDLTTLDRFEIETLRGLRRLLTGYDKGGAAKKPFSVGVFGPPGAGKSFGVKQVANDIFGAAAWMEFNLSQFNGATDLIGAFHQVRDRVLSGITPVVFWDEFDSKSYEWLKFLLAPMQDGCFQEGQVSHWIGKCVFVFAGGTSPTFREFAPPDEEPLSEEERKNLRHFRLSKGPDFMSRLDAYYNVAGPNPRTLPRKKGEDPGPRLVDVTDVCYPIRRALLIRTFVAGKSDLRLDFDSDLLDALLLVPEYKHGARSLEKLVVPLKPKSGAPIRRAALPAPEQLAMHVGAEAFEKIIKRNVAFQNSNAMEDLAAAIHKYWRDRSADEGNWMAAHLNRPYSELFPIDKEDNRAAARRMPRVLALAGLALAGPDDPVLPDEPSIDEARSYLDFHIDLLAEGEHDGWMDHRLANGWRVGKPRVDELRIHNLLVRYADLPEKEKRKDKDSVTHYPDMAKLAGYRIVWLKG